jgi:hypothetical protein
MTRNPRERASTIFLIQAGSSTADDSTDKMAELGSVPFDIRPVLNANIEPDC